MALAQVGVVAIWIFLALVSELARIGCAHRFNGLALAALWVLLKIGRLLGLREEKGLHPERHLRQFDLYVVDFQAFEK